MNKTKTSKWAIAYLSLFQENNLGKSSTEIKEKIFDLCFKNEEPKKPEKKIDPKDSNQIEKEKVFIWIIKLKMLKKKLV